MIYCVKNIDEEKTVIPMKKLLGMLMVASLVAVSGVAYSESKTVDTVNPAHIHGRRSPVLSLAHPKTILATLAATAPRKAAIANMPRASLPEMSVARSGSNIVRNGI